MMSLFVERKQSYKLMKQNSKVFTIFQPFQCASVSLVDEVAIDNEFQIFKRKHILYTQMSSYTCVCL